MHITLKICFVICLMCDCFPKNVAAKDPGCKEVKCRIDPCILTKCEAHPEAECRENNCGGCFAEFYLNDVKLELTDCIIHQQS